MLKNIFNKSLPKKAMIILGAFSMLIVGALSSVNNLNANAWTPDKACTAEENAYGCVNVNKIVAQNGTITVNLQNSSSGYFAGYYPKYANTVLNGRVTTYGSDYYFEYNIGEHPGIYDIYEGNDDKAYIHDYDYKNDVPLYDANNVALDYSELESDPTNIHTGSGWLLNEYIKVSLANPTYVVEARNAYDAFDAKYVTSKSNNIIISGLTNGHDYSVYVWAYVKYFNGIDYIRDGYGYINYLVKNTWISPIHIGATPTIKGTVKVGKKVKVSVSKKAPTTGNKYYYAWYAGKKKVSSKSSYKIAKKYKGKKLTVKVTIKRAGYTNVTVKSKAKTIKK
jgi:hypothetical protein